MKLTAAEIKKIDLAARQRFTYVADKPGRDQWRSFADSVLTGSPWTGDCDDLTFTTLDLLHRAGHDPAAFLRLMVSTTGTDRVDHMIGAAEDADGQTWIVGDTFGRAYKWPDLRHKVLLVSPGTDRAWFKPLDRKTG